MFKGILLTVVVLVALWGFGYLNISPTEKGNEAATSIHNSVKNMVDKR